MEADRVLPAYAGMIPGGPRHRRTRRRAPRLRGDDPYGGSLAALVVKCSPPTRG